MHNKGTGRTAFRSFFVNGLPDFDSSGGGTAGAGNVILFIAVSARSTSGSLSKEEPSFRLDPRSKYGLCVDPGSRRGIGLWMMSKRCLLG